MSQTQTALNELADGLDADDPIAVQDALDSYEASIEGLSAEESIQLAKANAAKRAEISLADRDSLNEFTKRLGQVSIGRAGMLTSGATYLLAPAKADEDSIAASVRTHAANVQSFADWQETANSIIEAIELPTSLAFVAHEPEADALLGETMTLTVDLYNVGDEPASQVDVVSTQDGEIQSSVPSSLEAGEHVTIDVTVAFTENRTYTIELVATSADIEAKTLLTPVSLGVRTKGEAVALISQKLRDLDSRIKTATIPKGQRKSLRSKVSAARDSVKRAESHLGRGKVKAANNQLQTASNQLTALVNSLSSKGKSDAPGKRKGKGNRKNGGKKFTDAFVVGTLQQVDSILALLSDARNASVE